MSRTVEIPGGQLSDFFLGIPNAPTYTVAREPRKDPELGQHGPRITEAYTIGPDGLVNVYVAPSDQLVPFYVGRNGTVVDGTLRFETDRKPIDRQPYQATVQAVLDSFKSNGIDLTDTDNVGGTKAIGDIQVRFGKHHPLDGTELDIQEPTVRGNRIAHDRLTIAADSDSTILRRATTLWSMSHASRILEGRIATYNASGNLAIRSFDIFQTRHHALLDLIAYGLSFEEVSDMAYLKGMVDRIIYLNEHRATIVDVTAA